MRIIGGHLGGRKFLPPADDWPTRPTTDYAKEGLFNILTNIIPFESTVMLDLFGGTGSHSYEFVSRGCRDVTYVDKYPSCVHFVKKTCADLDIEDSVKIIKSDVFAFLKHNTREFDYIFAGPPYPLPNLKTIPDVIFQYDTLKLGGLFVLEHNPKQEFRQHIRFVDQRSYGSTIFTFFK